MKKPVIISLIIIVFVIICCCIVLVVSGAVYTIFKSTGSISSQVTESNNNHSSQQEAVPYPTPLNTPVDATQDDLISSTQMQTVLETSNVPISNYYDLATRLLGKKNLSLTLPAPLIPPAIDDQQKFWVTDTDSHETFKVNVSLRYITDHLYFWVEDGVEIDGNALEELAKTFEEDIYPTNREFFGSEWTPGVDNDQHLYIVLASNLGDNLAGYFSSADEYNPAVHEYSNAHEMFLLNSDNIILSDEFTYGVLAHEFQHMIHWYRDLNEETWLNEGFSELSALLNGYDVGGFDQAYIMNTDMQLTDWASDLGDNSPHYGASFLFVSYFLDRFGEDATKSVIAAPENGMTSIDKTLADMNEKDPQTGIQIAADDIFSDWVITNYLNDSSVGDGRYQYKKYKNFTTAGYTEQIDTCPTETTTASVYQYGADYIKLECSGSYTLDFKGQPLVNILDVNPNSGKYAFWSNKGDESDMTLTREFDLSDATGPLTLSYSTWYDLEEDYDYAYVEISEDGQNWNILRTPGGTDKDISGNSFGWGYNGTTNGWVEESVDISDYAGKIVQIRFEYITDAAVNGEGMLLDDIRIPEINYEEDFESNAGDWIGAGFVRMNNLLPQTYRLNLIQFDRNNVTITPVRLDENLSAQIPLDIKSGQTMVLTVSGTTRFTRQPATYEYSIK